MCEWGDSVLMTQCAGAALVAVNLHTNEIAHASKALAELAAWLYPTGLEGGFLRPLLHEDDAAAFQVRV